LGGSLIANDVAAWMMTEIERREPHGFYQEDAAHLIQRQFGREFIYENQNGNWAIDKKVLAAFKKLSGTSVVWDRSYRYWRLRRTSDGPGRQQGG
jgi:hypothetical protein